MLDHLDPFVRRSVALALFRMLTGTRYDITVLRNALQSAGLDGYAAAVRPLALHHCARYSDLPPGFHAQLANHTMGLFSDGPFVGTGILSDLAGIAGLDPQSAPVLPTVPAHPAAQA